MASSIFHILLLLALFLPGVSAGFDWGDGCGGGSGTFTQSLPTMYEPITIGTIPAGKFNLVIKLESGVDVDVVLFDADNSNKKSKCDGVLPIISYSETKDQCKKGPLGNNDGTAEKMTYDRMKISYSGYFGVNGKPGKEFIKVEGEVKKTLEMRVVAYALGGTAKV